MSAPAAKPERRSRLTPEREDELLRTVVELLSETGYEALTMDAIATRSRASKATLYRQWQDKPTLVITAMKHVHPVFTGDTDTGTLAGDLHTVARRLARKDSDLMIAMGQAVMRDPDLAEVFRELLIKPEHEAFRQIVMRAVARGELQRVPASLDLCAPMLVQQVANRPICLGLDCTEEFLVEVVDHVILPSLRHS